MDVHDEWLPEELYTDFLRHMPEACVDVVVEHDGRVLVARRENEPAKGEWFWPGSRLFKGEALADAASRVAREELGIEVDVVEQLGATTHVWDTSEQSDDVARHTVLVVYRVHPTGDDPEPTLDEQHSAVRWLEAPDPGLHEYVNRYLRRWDLPRDDGGTAAE
jgi:colanic acid biosynthesis protein WcaH